ncbi:uncharacterized protein LOC142224046 [Haematobia irritans]|uniref:uncharacterized protein LOC142224046 n=1 Tax=Haematobia irritans TaxID=7368 RepID=UPI003F4F91DA
MNKIYLQLFVKILIVQYLFLLVATFPEANYTTLKSQRYKLFEYAYNHINEITLSPKVLNQTLIYLNDLRAWTYENHEDFRKMNIYQELQNAIDNHINMLMEVKSKPYDCKNLFTMSNHQQQVKRFQTVVEDEKLLREWMEMDRVLLRKILFATIRKYKTFYRNLHKSVAEYLNNLDSNDILLEKDLQQWYDKFANIDLDFVDKLLLVNEFMSLFKEEMNEIQSKCMTS